MEALIEEGGEADRPSEATLERIMDAFYSGGCRGVTPVDGVTFLDVHQHNACNHTLSGVVDVDGSNYGFIIHDGDLNGTEVAAWGAPDVIGCYTPEPSEPRIFVPSDDFLHDRRPELFKVYLAWRKAHWFREKERSYNYDRHFQPGVVVEQLYGDWAVARGLKPGYLSNLPDGARAAIAKAEAEEERER